MKRLTAYGTYIEWTEENKVEPTREEFMELGYSQATYYRAKAQYKKEKKEGEQR